jgi:hypothetical protein
MADETISESLDLEQIRADREAGLSLAAIGSKHGRSKATIFRALNGGGQRANTRKVNGNGSGNGHAAPDELRALEEIINSRWQHLGLAEKLRLLLQ